MLRQPPSKKYKNIHTNSVDHIVEKFFKNDSISLQDKILEINNTLGKYPEHSQEIELELYKKAIHKEDIGVIQWFVQKMGVDVKFNIAGGISTSSTPLKVAVQVGNQEIVKIIAKQFDDANLLALDEIQQEAIRNDFQGINDFLSVQYALIKTGYHNKNSSFVFSEPIQTEPVQKDASKSNKVKRKVFEISSTEAFDNNEDSIFNINGKYEQENREKNYNIIGEFENLDE
jgi:hypothetical protein